MEAAAREKPEVKMTMRVYRVNGDGVVTEDRGVVSVPEFTGTVAFDKGYPPCLCPRHRAGRQASP
jgi:hypothetical protein